MEFLSTLEMIIEALTKQSMNFYLVSCEQACLINADISYWANWLSNITSHRYEILVAHFVHVICICKA